MDMNLIYHHYVSKRFRCEMIYNEKFKNFLTIGGEIQHTIEELKLKENEEKKF